MVSLWSIVFMGISAILSIGVPVFLIFYLKMKKKVSLKPFFVGALAFFIVVQFIEAPINYYFLKINEGTSSILTGNPFIYSLYGGFMAGIFEEGARLICFMIILKKYRSFDDGICYGVGHGGIESILIGAMASISAIANSVLINSGAFSTVLENAGISESLINSMMEQYISAPVGLWLMVGVERVFALGIQIALSVIVLYAVRKKKYLYFVLAIILHATIDIPAGLYQAGYINNIYIIELVIAAISVLMLTFAFRLKKKYN